MADLLADVQMSWQMWLVICLVGAVLILYVTEWVPMEVTSLGLISVLVMVFTLFPMPLRGKPGMLDAGSLLAGFGSPALIAVLSLLVVGEALLHTGALDFIVRLVTRQSFGYLRFSVLLIGVGVISAFMNNTPVVVMFIPIVQQTARKLGLPNSRVMMPLSFIAILGGMTTLIGSSTNLLVSNALVELGEAPLGFFECASAGLILAAVGAVYVLLVLPTLLPERSSLSGEATDHGRHFISQLTLQERSPLIGQTAIAGLFPGLSNLTVRMIQRGEHAKLPPFDDYPLRAGDILIVAAPRSTLSRLAARSPEVLSPSLVPEETTAAKNSSLRRGYSEQHLAEVMISPLSTLTGQSLRQSRFHQHYRCVTVGVLRRTRMVRVQMTDLPLEAGDVLLVRGHDEDLRALCRDRDFVLVSGTSRTIANHHKAIPTVIIFTCAIALAAFGIMPIAASALGAATLLIAIGALSLRRAAQAINVKIVLTVAASLALGEALFHTGGAQYIAASLTGMLSGTSLRVVLSGFFLLVALFTNVLSNNACAVLFTPIGYELAQRLGADPRLLAITVLLASNCCFLSPVGYKTNLLVLGPGRYAFVDFVKWGTPLLALLWGTFTLVVPWLIGR